MFKKVVTVAAFVMAVSILGIVSAHTASADNNNPRGSGPWTMMCDGGCRYIATADVAVTPATCDKAEQLVYGHISYATFSGTPNSTYGPANYSVIATATNGALFNSGKPTLTFSGTLSGPLTGSDCTPPPVKPGDTVSTSTSSSLDCTTKLVTTTTTTSTTTYSLQGNKWVANAPVITTTSTNRPATADELKTCPAETTGTTGTTGTGTGSTAGPVAQLPYTSGNSTLANVLTLSAIAAGAIALSIVARRTLGRQV